MLSNAVPDIFVQKAAQSVLKEMSFDNCIQLGMYIRCCPVMIVASSFDAWYNVLQDVDPMGMLLFDYLVHEGHWDTANRVAEDILLGRVEVSQEVGSAGSS